jgi:hypothetical protein
MNIEELRHYIDMLGFRLMPTYLPFGSSDGSLTKFKLDNNGNGNSDYYLFGDRLSIELCYYVDLQSCGIKIWVNWDNTGKCEWSEDLKSLDMKNFLNILDKFIYYSYCYDKSPCNSVLEYKVGYHKVIRSLSLDNKLESLGI